MKLTQNYRLFCTSFTRVLQNYRIENSSLFGGMNMWKEWECLGSENNEVTGKLIMNAVEQSKYTNYGLVSRSNSVENWILRDGIETSHEVRRPIESMLLWRCFESALCVQGDQNGTQTLKHKQETKPQYNRSLGYDQTMFRQFPIFTVLSTLRKQISLICLLTTLNISLPKHRFCFILVALYIAHSSR
jgi:hypothetical protein